MRKIIPLVWFAFGCACQTAPAQINAYPFQNQNLPVGERVRNAVSLMTLDEKIGFLHFRAGVPRLGIPPLGSAEGLHGEAMGGVANWTPKPPIPTTIFPQAIGLGETWDPEILRQAAAVEGYEARYIAQNEKYKKGGLV